MIGDIGYRSYHYMRAKHLVNTEGIFHLHKYFFFPKGKLGKVHQSAHWNFCMLWTLLWNLGMNE